MTRLVPAFLPRVVVGVGEHERVSRLGQSVLGAANHRREERVRDVGNEHPDRERPARLEPARHAVHPIPERVGGLADALHGLRAHHRRRSLVERARGGPGVHTCRLRHILQAGSAHGRILPTGRRPNPSSAIVCDRTPPRHRSPPDACRASSSSGDSPSSTSTSSGSRVMPDARASSTISDAKSCVAEPLLDQVPQETLDGRRDRQRNPEPLPGIETERQVLRQQMTGERRREIEIRRRRASCTE